MRRLKRPVFIIGQVFKLIIGDNFTTPISEVIERYPYLRFDT